MRKLTIKEIKHIVLDMLKYFHDFCEKNNLTYYLAYGTLLGAVRHKGFIPWDDDIDVYMPRTDYEKFLKLFSNNNLNIVLSTIYNNANHYKPFARLLNKNTSVYQRSLKINNMSLWIDIFPLDNMSNDYKKAVALSKQCKKFKYLSLHKVHNFNMSNNCFKNLKNIVHKMINLVIPLKYLLIKMDKLSKKYMQEEMTKYIGNVSDVKIEVYESIYFKEKILFEFENYKFWGPKEYDKVLTEYYGNYMKLPPESERVGHRIEAYCNEN